MEKSSKMIIANWKMNGSKALIDSFASQLQNVVLKYESIFCLPCAFLDYAFFHFPKTISLGAQNCSEFSSGAYTGETSALHIKECGGQFIIIGHSERRTHYHETDEVIVKKVELILNNDLTPIICIGETHSVYTAHQTKDTLKKQLAYLQPLLKHSHSFVLAYEPIWAIGTGLTPSLDEIQEIHDFIYQEINLSPLYGGSVNYDNYDAIISLPHVGGLLVGGESLKLERFISMLAGK